MQRNYATVTGQVMNLEKQLKEAEEKLQTALEVEVAIMEAKQQTVAMFKEPEKYKLTTQDFDTGYNKGVEEIVYNIWRKCQGVYFKFLGKEYRKQIIIWEYQERACILNTRPPPFLEYFDEELLGDPALDVVGTQNPPPVA